MPRAEQFVLPPNDLISVSVPMSGETALPEGTRGLLVGTAGSLNVVINGTNRDGVPFVVGQNPGFFTALRPGGTASNLWAIV